MYMAVSITLKSLISSVVPSSMVPEQRFRHFGHYSRSFIIYFYLLTNLQIVPTVTVATVLATC